MVTISCLYNGKTNFEGILNQHGFNRNCPCLIRIYTAICTPDEAVALAKEIKSILPNSQIFGCSGSGVIYNGVQYQQDTLIVLEQMESTRTEIHTFTYEGKTASEVAAEVSVHLWDSPEASLMHIVCGGYYPDIHAFVHAFNVYHIPVKLVGGIAGDVLPKNITGYVFTECGMVQNGIVTVTYYNKDLHIFHRVNISHEPLSPVYHLHQCEGSLFGEIDGVPAKDWCKEQLGLKTLKVYDDWQMIAENDALLRFPIVLEGEHGASRFIKYDPDTQKMSLYFSKLPEGTPFRIGYVSPTKCVKESYSVCTEIEQHPIESLFCYTCLFRKLYLQNCAEWELAPFSDYGVCGVFMMGEIADIEGTNEFLNGSCCLAGIAEEDVLRIQPNYDVFADLYQIKDDNESLLHFVLKKQSEEMSRENKNLLEQLLTQQTLMQNQLYTDMHTGMPNSIKFIQDNQTLCFNKLCMISIENAELLISNLGKDTYYQSLRNICEEIFLYCKECSEEDVCFYVQNENILFVASNDQVAEDDFIDIVNGLYRKFQFRRLESQKELFISQFVLVLNQNDLLEKAFNTLKNCSNIQTDFLIWDSTFDSGIVQEDEMNMIYILNCAIEENRVIPYFQGIHDNQAGKINKYEALMRIEDGKGNVYVPGDFMHIAKKYHLYAKISVMMIEQVLELFAGRKEIVSINLSAYDINFNSTCDKIFQFLNKVGHADNLVFEILEDEKFRDLTMLKKFIAEVRKYGVKIAIDDFGSGYSNFMELAEMEPDFIKIDGSIIKDVVDNVLHQKVSENIVFLGKQLNAQLVAEFVENGAIQEKIEELNIHFSQGYYFARPKPYHELSLS